MTFEQLLQVDVEVLAQMSDEDLKQILGPCLEICPPVSITDIASKGGVLDFGSQGKKKESKPKKAKKKFDILEFQRQAQETLAALKAMQAAGKANEKSNEKANE